MAQVQNTKGTRMTNSKAGKTMSVREKITRRRNAAIGYASFNALAVTLISVLAAVSVIPWLALAGAAVMAVALISNATIAVKAQLALRAYRRNPLAAAITEMRESFKAEGWK
jgi:hypothetical protein